MINLFITSIILDLFLGGTTFSYGMFMLTEYKVQGYCIHIFLYILFILKIRSKYKVLVFPL